MPPGDPHDGWTIDSLHAHFLRILVDMEARFAQRADLNEKRFLAYEAAIREKIDSLERESKAAMQSLEKAIAKSEAASEKRFDSFNQFTNSIVDQSNKLISRTEVEQRIFAVADKINDLGDRMNRMEGRGLGVQTSWGVLVAATSVIILIAGIVVSFFKH